jgi:hypothetical protein
MLTLVDLGFRPHVERGLSFVLRAKAAWEAEHPVKTPLEALRRSQAFWEAIRPYIETDAERDDRIARRREGDLRRLLVAIQSRMADLRSEYRKAPKPAIWDELAELRKESAAIRSHLAPK